MTVKGFLGEPPDEPTSEQLDSLNEMWDLFHRAPTRLSLSFLLEQLERCGFGWNIDCDLVEIPAYTVTITKYDTEVGSNDGWWVDGSGNATTEAMLDCFPKFLNRLEG